MRRRYRYSFYGLGLLPLVLLCLWYLGAAGYLSAPESPGAISAAALPPALIEERARRYRGLGGRAKQILFGDLHVHSTFSFDAFAMSLSMMRGDGAHPPADACDFARHCSALDFWAITDHAERLPAARWREIIDTVRQCNSLAGNPENPDLHTFLGWEWTQTGDTAESHYGHRNVILAHTDDARIPRRPIAAPLSASQLNPPKRWHLMAMLAFQPQQRSLRFARQIRDLRNMELCPSYLPVQDLPGDCLETAARPAQLFARLREWGHDALVIPHGTTWGIYTPPGSNWRKQLRGGDYDPEYQALFEIFSGHGNTERYLDFAALRYDSQGRAVCPEETADYQPSCVRAGEIIAERCRKAGIAEKECDRRAAIARRHYVEAGMGGHMTVPGVTQEDWRDSGQCRSCFMPAFNYRPGNSAQYLLALRNFDAPPGRQRARPGFIASSDVHTARPGTGYKEYGITTMTEARDFSSLWLRRGGAGPEPKSKALPLGTPVLLEGERLAAFFGTGGLVAVHADGRGKKALWAALKRREVYGTSGPRILLWFDLLDGESKPQAPMGAIVQQRENPSFRVRAVASFAQQPGCPPHARQALGEERLEQLCRGECFFPSRQRRRLSRIDVIRIHSQQSAGEPVAQLVEDPWRSYDCAGKAVCEVQFEDEEYAAGGRSSIYYVRAIEEASEAVNGANLGCEYDEKGQCTRMRNCVFGWQPGEDCLGRVEERAWSSPIYVDYPATDPL